MRGKNETRKIRGRKDGRNGRTRRENRRRKGVVSMVEVIGGEKGDVEKDRILRGSDWSERIRDRSIRGESEEHEPNF